MSACIVADKTVLAAQSTTPVLAVVRERAGGFTKAKDSRGREVEGLWKRNGRFYCQFSIPGTSQATSPHEGRMLITGQQAHALSHARHWYLKRPNVKSSGTATEAGLELE